MLGPILEGSKVRLEPPSREHMAAWTRWRADMQVARYLNLRAPRTLQGQTEWLEMMAKDESSVLWSVMVSESGQHVGGAWLDKIDWRTRHAESALVLGETSAWGKGYATAAGALMTRYAFRELNFEKVWATVMGDNASRKTLEKLGYRQCGLMRRHGFVDGRWHDQWLGEILRDEWEAREENKR
jgi:RimJ/RimL family protein N-acetyltransferase